MKLPLVLCATLVVSGAAIAADTKPAKPKPCPKGTVATTSKITGDRYCFAPQPMMMTPAQPAGSKVTPPVRKTN